MYLNGVVLVSAILNFQTTEFDVGNELPYATIALVTSPIERSTASRRG